MSAFLGACGPGEPNTQDEAGSDDALYVRSGSIWPSTTIRVCWEGEPNAYPVEREWVRSAVGRTWATVSNAQFLGWNTCPLGTFDGIRIGVSDEGPHVIALGSALRTARYGMILNFEFASWGTACASQRESCISNIAVHEFGHALGFAHEQNRPDTPEWCDDVQGSNGDVTIGSWDLHSVMNYCNPLWGGRGKPSRTDILGVQQYYGVNPMLEHLVFDAQFYLEHIDLMPVFQPAGANYDGHMDASFHWLSHGILEGRVGSPGFEPFFYLRQNADLSSAFGMYNYGAAMTHWRQSGIDEGRAGSPAFDVRAYLRMNTDIAAAYGATNYRAAFEHWALHGLNEGRMGSPAFVASFYLARYADLRNAFGANNYASALRHFVQFGLREGRASSPVIDAGYYLGRYPDLRNAFGATGYEAAYHHWLTSGLNEGRRASAEFDPQYYLANNPDLIAAFGPTNYRSAMEHWLVYGRAEGRRGAP